MRRLGVELGLPREMVYPPSVPGPGPRRAHPRRGDEREYADLLRQADAIFIEELRAPRSLRQDVSQAFAVFLPVRSVGVMGDGRRYDYVIALRAVETVDFMTAHWARLPYDFLDRVLAPHRQRSEGHLARRLRHLGQAAGDDRVGVSAALPLYAAARFRAAIAKITNVAETPSPEVNLLDLNFLGRIRRLAAPRSMP